MTDNKDNNKDGNKDNNENKVNWIDLFFKIHEQTHVYWKTIFAVPLLIVGWSTTTDEISVVSAWLIVILVIFLILFLTQALVKVYRFMHSCLKELQLCRWEDGAFNNAIQNLKLLDNWKIYSVNICMAVISCVAVVYQAYSV